MLTELSVSLFSILLLPSLHNKVYTLFLYFTFLRNAFCKFLIFFLDEQISFLRLFYSLSLSSSRSKFSTFSSFSIRFCSCRFSLILFGFSWTIRFVLIHSNTVKSCFQAYVFSSPKILYFFSEKKAVMPFQVRFRNHNGTVGFQFQ